MNMTLPEYISEIGDEEAAKRFAVPVRTIQSWRRRERYPRPLQARRIVEASEGRLTLDGVYQAEAKAATNAA